VTIELFAVISDLIAAVAVVISLVYLGVQVRQNTRVTSANSRHSISQFALDITIFKAQNADRLALIESDAELSEGDKTFRYWNHMTLFLHAETYFHHFELGLMPADHWSGYAQFFEGYLETRGVRDFWENVGPAFSGNFARWVDTLCSSAPGPTGARQ
jgi:hypothetical protein